jgi:hypothetical protein
MPAEHIPAGFEVTRDRRRSGEAAAVVVHIPTVPTFHRLPRKLPGQVWVAWSAESDQHYRRLRSDRFMSRFELSMTYRRDADVPVLYIQQYADLAASLRSRPPLKDDDRLVAAFVSSRADRSGRRRYMRELARCLELHSYGRYLRNRRLDVDRGRETKLDTIARYKFTLAFENSVAPDYVTEKFYDPLVAGSVPVVLGAPNVRDFAPGENCYLDIRDFDGPRALADRLRELGTQDDQYESLHAWRLAPFRTEFLEQLEQQEVPVGIRLLRLLEARLGAEPDPAL